MLIQNMQMGLYHNQQNKLMYNLHQYNSAVRMSERQRLEQENLAKYALRHQDFKEKAHEKQVDKVSAFIREQSESERPFVFEDDHYKHWRPLKQFRDIEDTTKFLAFKTFRHKPHYQMDKYFNERQRKEIQELSQRKEHLVRSKIIPEEQRSRSLRCQGPLNPKIEFRPTKKDQEYLQPRLRFSCITDRERISESALTYDDKFKQLYKSFEMTKSKLGRQTISPKKDRSTDQRDSLECFQDCNTEMTKSKQFYFEREQSGVQPLDAPAEPTLSINPEVSSRSGAARKSKLYFKLAKTMHLLGKDQRQKEELDTFLKRTQYERKKDLTNIRSNLHHENYYKRPIL